MKNQVISNNVQEKLLSGVEIVASAVASTLGPRGANVAINRGYDVWVNHDGVSVARSIELEDPIQATGARIVREAAQKQVDAVGDGTTVVMILAHALIKESQKLIAAGVNSQQLRDELWEAGKKVVSKINESILKPEKKYLEKVAIVSCRSNDLGEKIAEAVRKAGDTGAVTVEESRLPETKIEHQEGMQIEKGYISPYFITDPDHMRATLEKAKVFITDRPMVNIAEMIPFFERVAKETNTLFIMAPDIGGNVLPSLIATKMQGAMNILAVKPPYFGVQSKNFMQDIALMTGARMVTVESGEKFEGLSTDVLGSAEYITSSSTSTIIRGGGGDKELIQAHIESLKKRLDDESSDFEAEKIKERIAKLGTGVFAIQVGGSTEIEMKERLERAKDALEAVKAARKHGVVPGGETVYLNAISSLGDSYGERIMKNAIVAPFDRLLKNAGLDSGKYLQKLEDMGYGNNGVDVTTGEVVDMVSAGIIDPAAVSLNAIENALSVAGSIITTKTLVIPVEEKK